MSNPFKVGQVVTPNDNVIGICPKALTKGKAYEIKSISSDGDFIRVQHDTRNHSSGFKWQDFTLYTGAATASDYTAAVLADDDLTYEERQAAKPVTSQGKFTKGQVVVYCDGTDIPNNEARTVLRCTATCVWFEETYSMPFNPDEFTEAY